MQAADITGERTGIACRIVETTAKTIIVVTEGRKPRRLTLPLAQVRVCANGSISIPEWLAKERELI